LVIAQSQDIQLRLRCGRLADRITAKTQTDLHTVALRVGAPPARVMFLYSGSVMADRVGIVCLGEKTPSWKP
jgi:hypothetical protein